MIYHIKERFWSMGGRFAIRDEQDREVYLVKGKAFSWGNSLSFQDSEERELATIEQKLLRLKPTYDIHIKGAPFAQMTKEFSWFKKKFCLDVPGPNDYEIEGSFWSHEFIFRRANRVVARVSKNSWGFSDKYGVDIDNEEDHVAILCACIVIDQVTDDAKRT